MLDRYMNDCRATISAISFEIIGRRLHITRESTSPGRDTDPVCIYSALSVLSKVVTKRGPLGKVAIIQINICVDVVGLATLPQQQIRPQSSMLERGAWRSISACRLEEPRLSSVDC
ncbi:hypothetical protein EVAR_3372_1 [Eumeta japonica]|uniref:Uncharacterized protein n=1 Tax=Eumeta variegata TaxID=151549 RepID=A0A4C1SUX3_EUMVA|nr:hypothetical protein EVAR_3372_1 [Eumeta japonica]